MWPASIGNRSVAKTPSSSLPAGGAGCGPEPATRRFGGTTVRRVGAGTDALSGISVVDFSSTFAGALTTQLLADYGAHVVLVEPPGGTVLRGQPAWPAWGRGKDSVVLDLTGAAGRAAARRLAEGADVVVRASCTRR
jgi:hypothetical protein